jgi:hypothetical protein
MQITVKLTRISTPSISTAGVRRECRAELLQRGTAACVQRAPGMERQVFRKPHNKRSLRFRGRKLLGWVSLDVIAVDRPAANHHARAP